MSYMDQRVSSSTDPAVREDDESLRRENSNSPSRRNRRRDDSPSRFRRDRYHSRSRSRSPRRSRSRSPRRSRSRSPRRSRSRSRSPHRAPSQEGYDEYEDVQLSPNRLAIMERSRTNVVVFFPIPEHCVGLVIGRNGNEIQQISNNSNCRVQVATDKSKTGYRLVEIEGRPENINAAKALINEVVARANLRMPQQPQPPSVAAPEPPKSSVLTPKISIDIPIPAHKCGSIIGKGGETMKKLRAWSNCFIQLIQENNIANMDKPLRITGEPHAVEQAKKLVLDILANGEETPSASFMAGNGPVATMTLHVKIPRTCVGAIMGLQGKNIRKLSDETGTKIQFLPDDDIKLMERSLAIIGNHTKVYIAAQLIKEIVDANNSESTAPVSLFYMCIPASKCGLVIGKGGETIKQINTDTGAYCELSREKSLDPNEKTFVIRGSELQVEHAKHLICQKVGDIPPNTPFNPQAIVNQNHQHIQPQGMVIQQHLPHMVPTTATAVWNGHQMVPLLPTGQLYQTQQQHQPGPEWQRSPNQHVQQIPQQLMQQIPQQMAQHPIHVPQKVYHPQQLIPQQHQPQPQASPVSQYAQYVGQMSGQPSVAVQQQVPQSPPKQSAAAASVEQNNEPVKEGETDYSAQWLEYYISIGETEAADGVRARIAKMEEEKAMKAAAAARGSQPNESADGGLTAAQLMENERLYQLQMAHQHQQPRY